MRQHFALRRILLRSLTLFFVVPLSAGAGVRETVKEFESGGAVVTIDCFAPTAKGTHPLILLLHGSGGLEGATHDCFQSVARGLANQGYVALIPHYFDSEGGLTSTRP